MTDKDRVRKIHNLIRLAERHTVRRMPWLKKQNAIGFTIFMTSVLVILWNALGYYMGWFPTWGVIVSIGIWASLLHELEHDLIHKLYFKESPLIHNTMMMGVWLFRGNTVNPWFRRKIHLLHHRDSGQTNDIEERLVGLGLPWGIKRILVTIDPLMALLQFRALNREIPQFSVLSTFLAGNPTVIIFDGIWYTFLADLVSRHFFATPLVAASTQSVLAFLVVVYVAPNILRSLSLNFITTACHYFGDIEKNNLVQQVQVLNKWYYWPLQIFCFNFGSTHVIHHFVVNQPFYLRQLVAPYAHRALKKYGVRVNDVGATLRMNRFKAF